MVASLSETNWIIKYFPRDRLEMMKWSEYLIISRYFLASIYFEF